MHVNVSSTSNIIFCSQNLEHFPPQWHNQQARIKLEFTPSSKVHLTLTIIMSRLPTANRFIKFNILVQPICPLCQTHPESIDCPFFYCSFYIKLWDYWQVNLQFSFEYKSTWILVD